MWAVFLCNRCQQRSQPFFWLVAHVKLHSNHPTDAPAKGAALVEKAHVRWQNGCKQVNEPERWCLPYEINNMGFSGQSIFTQHSFQHYHAHSRVTANGKKCSKPSPLNMFKPWTADRPNCRFNVIAGNRPGFLVKCFVCAVKRKWFSPRCS